MLATQRMSSHGGQLPFGYNPMAIQSIGLPEFLSPGEPMGQSILNDEESSTLNHFFSDFESNQPPQPMPLQFAPPQSSSHHLPYAMPPLYFGSETSDGTGPGIDPHTLHLDGQPQAYPNQPTYDLQILHVSNNSFGQGVVVDNNNNNNNHVGVSDANTGAANTRNSHSTNSNNQFNPPLLDQLPTAADSVQHPQPGFTSNWNQQPYQPQGMPLQTPGRGPIMRFGSDSHFTQSGFQLPNNSSSVVDSEDATLNHWLPSAPNSQPPTQPNTQPSSPNWPKKRKLDDLNVGSNNTNNNNNHNNSRNGYHGVSDHSGHRSQHSQSLGQVKYETQSSSLPPNRLPGSHARAHRPDLHHSDETDAAAESDDDTFNSHSAPGLWPNNPGQACHANGPPSADNPPKKRRKSIAPTTPNVSSTSYPNSYSNSNNGLSSNRVKPSPGKTARGPSTRVPLTTEQKKANHTNSEQRRRDATARAYAELYDLVPEVAEMGKQSTMKKLELVVDKVSWTIRAVESLRAKLGIKKGSGADLMPGHCDDSFVNHPVHPAHPAHIHLDGLVHDARADGEACYPDLE